MIALKIPLGKKIVLFIIIVAILLSGTCIFVSGVAVKNMMDKEYIITADSMAATVAETIDGDKMQIITDKVMEIYNNTDLKHRFCNS